MYKILIDKRAAKFISRLPHPDKIRIISAIERLPYSGDIKRMKGHEGLYRLRVGDYRVIYSVDNGKLIVCVIDAGNRGQIYAQY